jgi:uncharacterized protein DUF4157
MTARVGRLAAPEAARSRMNSTTLASARRCQCGGAAGVDGTCHECRSRRLAPSGLDALEQEAERAVAALVEPPGIHAGSLTRAAGPLVQRQEATAGPKPPTQFPAQQQVTSEHDIELWKKAIQEIVKRVAKETVLPRLGATPEGKKIVAFLQSPLGKAVAAGVLGGATAAALGVHAGVAAASEQPTARTPSGEQSFGALGTTGPVETKGVRIFGIDVAPPEKPKEAKPTPPDPAAKTYPRPPAQPRDPAAEDRALQAWLLWNLEHRDDIVQAALQAGSGLGKAIDPMTAFELWLDLLAKRPVEEERKPLAPKALPERPLTYQFKRREGSSEQPGPEIVEGLRSPSAPLTGATRRLMEAHFGHDFGAVRVHTDARAAAAAEAAGALAYTVGTHIVFGAGQYAPEAPAGKALLAHELAHTIQQEGAGAQAARSLSLAPGHGQAEQEAERSAIAPSFGRPPRLTSAPIAIARQRSGNLKAIRNWSFVAYDKEVRLIYYEAPPKTEEDPYAEQTGKKPRAIQIGTIPWLTNNPGNITVDPKKEAVHRAAGAIGGGPAALVAGPATAAALETLQTAPYRLGATGTFRGRYAIFPTSPDPKKDPGRAAILPYLRAIARFRQSPNMTVAEALKNYKGQEPGEGPEVRDKYVQDIRSFMVAAGSSPAEADAIMNMKVADVTEETLGAGGLVSGLMRKEGATARPGVTFNCNGFRSPPKSLYDVREQGIMETLRSSVLANDELRGILGCP